MQGLLFMTNDRRQKDDFYPTPPEAVEALLAVEHFNSRVWEPACGAGHISKVLRSHDHKVISTDLNDFGFGETGIDFLLESKMRAETIITNPPYKLANQFVRHAINMIHPACHLAWRQKACLAVAACVSRRAGTL